MHSDRTIQGIRVVRGPLEAAVSNNRRCRVLVQVDGQDDRIIPAAGPSEWFPSVRFACAPDAAIRVLFELEGVNGPNPFAVGPFAPNKASEIVFEGER